MKTTTFFVLSLFLVASLPCFAFSITFTGTGASTTVGDVLVQNLTKGTSVTVPSGNTLNLTVVSAVEHVSATDETIHVYSNSVEGKSTVSFFAKQTGVTQINAFGIDGRKIAGITANLQAGMNSFQLSLPKGSFVIQVTGNGYTCSAKMINQSTSPSKPEITIGTEKPATSFPQKSKSSTLGITAMDYTTGDQLLYKAVSGNYSTIVTDVPADNKTTNFDFVACTDADGNNYTVVTIGDQTWMAENLKTTQYNDNTAIPNVTVNTAWAALTTPAYCWYNNDATTYKNLYGALYNWHAVNTAILAPTGWHVATAEEWTTLIGSDSLVTKRAKALAATTNWVATSTAGAVGNDLSKNNSSGFSALPGGKRVNGAFWFVGTVSIWWTATWYSETSSYVYTRVMTNTGATVAAAGDIKERGYSVRCVKD